MVRMWARAPIQRTPGGGDVPVTLQMAVFIAVWVPHRKDRAASHQGVHIRTRNGNGNSRIRGHMKHRTAVRFGVVRAVWTGTSGASHLEV